MLSDPNEVYSCPKKGVQSDRNGGCLSTKGVRSDPNKGCSSPKSMKSNPNEECSSPKGVRVDHQGPIPVE